MNRTVIWVIVILVVVLGGGYYLLNRTTSEPYQSSTPPPATTPPPAAAPPSSTAKTYTISMTANGFSPADLAIKVGDTVMFKNDDTRDHWPASDPHPIHNICPGFDALGGVPPGGNYSYTFTVAKQCPFHDHLMPRTKGSITVTQ